MSLPNEKSALNSEVVPGISLEFARINIKEGARVATADKAAVANAIPFGRIGLPSDLTSIAIFLETDEAYNTIAQRISFDNGNWIT